MALELQHFTVVPGGRTLVADVVLHPAPGSITAVPGANGAGKFDPGHAPLCVKRLMGFVCDLRDRGVGILLIEQFTDLVLGASEEAIVLRSGRVRHSRRAENLLKDPWLLDRAYFGIDAAQTGAHVSHGGSTGSHPVEDTSRRGLACAAATARPGSV